MFALLSAAQIQGFPINTPTMQKQWPAGYPNMIKSYKDASAEVSLGGWARAKLLSQLRPGSAAGSEAT